MAKSSTVSAEVFCVTWQKSAGDSNEVANILGQTHNNVVNRYKKYVDLGINLCEMKEIPRKKKICLADLVPELNKKIAEVSSGN